MVLWEALVGAAGVAAAVWAARQAARRAAAGALPPGVPSADHEWLGCGGDEHVAAAREALRQFAAEYRATARHGACTAGAVARLFELRTEALAHLRALRMRLPNDLALEQRLVQHTEDTDRVLREYLDDARRRSGATLLHPGPLDDTQYRRWYRAANDVMA